MWAEAELVEAFHGIGLCEGDLVLVHSSLRALGPVDGGASTLIDALLKAVGPSGTVSVPTHTFRVVNTAQPVFHQTLTPSNLGVLPNVFRQRAEAVRGLHPTHSLAAIGPKAKEFVAGQECESTPCALGGPYDRLRQWGGKILILGVGLECCTFFHGCEEWAELPMATREEASQFYSITAEGQVYPIQLHTHMVNTWDQYPRLEPALRDVGALRISHIGTCETRLLDARKAADWLVPQLQRDASIILPPVKSP